MGPLLHHSLFRLVSTWLLRKCFLILQVWNTDKRCAILLGGCLPPDPQYFLGGGLLPSPRPPHLRIIRGFAPQTPLRKSEKLLEQACKPGCWEMGWFFYSLSYTFGFYNIKEAHKQDSLLDTIFNYIFYLGPPGKNNI